MTERLMETVAAVLETHAVRGRRVAVGLSGGVDSVVLLDVLGRLRNDLRLALSAIHVNHQLSAHALDGKQYQQWSRHRTAANPWRPGLDNVGTHLIQVDSWLQREL